MTSDTMKALKIKTNSVKRLHKELGYYVAEKEKESARLGKFREHGGSASDIKQAESVLAESSMMVPETRQRLETALTDLKSFLVESAEHAHGTDELEAAQEVVAMVEAEFQL